MLSPTSCLPDHLEPPEWGRARPPGPSDDTPPGAAMSLASRSVLVVEDSWHVAQALQCLLENAGMDVAGPVATTADARRLVAGQLPEMAVVDVNLGTEMSYGLIDQLLGQGVAVVVVSGYEVLPSLEHKVAAILTKPVRADALLSALRRIASTQRRS